MILVAKDINLDALISNLVSVGFKVPLQCLFLYCQYNAHGIEMAVLAHLFKNCALKINKQTIIIFC